MKRTRREPATRRHAGAQVLATLVAALVVFAQLSNLGHFVLVEHAVCLEHGEWVHADEQEPHGVQTSNANPERPVFRAATTDADEHEHCFGVCQRRERFALPPCVVTLALAPEGEELARDFLEARERKALIPVFLIAPKTSPPG